MKLAVHMNEQTIKQVKGFLTCCARIGSVLLIEASPSQMLWRTINSAKSCCILITLESAMFDHYVLYTVTSMNASVLLKHFLSAFRTPKIKQVEMEIHDGDSLTITVDSESGLHKKYQVACVDEEHLVATFDRDNLPTSITADAFQLYKVLTSFQASLDEVTLLARPEGNGNMQPIRLASYVPPAKQKLHQRKGGLLRTSIQIDTRGRQLFKHYRTSTDQTLDVTFNVKDFTVLVQLCKQVQADVVIHMGAAGTPVLAEATWPSGGGPQASSMAAEILLATIGESVQSALSESMPASGNTTPGGGAARLTPGGVATPATGTPALASGHAEAVRDAARSHVAQTTGRPQARGIAAQTPAGALQATLATPAPRAAPPTHSGRQTAVAAAAAQHVGMPDHAQPQTPPNLGAHRAPHASNAGAAPAVPQHQQCTPHVAAVAASGGDCGTAAGTPQDGSPHVNATFRADVGLGLQAEAPAEPSGPATADAGDIPPFNGPRDGGNTQDAAAGASRPVAGGSGTWGGGSCAGTAQHETSKFASHLERLAAAIRQDEHMRHAQKMSAASPGGAKTGDAAAADVEVVSMRAVPEDDGEPVEWPEEGEFAADDDEDDCPATPPDARPETEFM